MIWHVVPQVRVDRSGFIAYRVVSLENQVVEDVVRNSKSSANVLCSLICSGILNLHFFLSSKWIFNMYFHFNRKQFDLS